MQYAGRDFSSPRRHISPLDKNGVRLQDFQCAGGINKRLSERSSLCVTVNCQLWYESEALLLPADKVAPLRSAEPLRLCTTLKERKGSGCSNIHSAENLQVFIGGSQMDDNSALRPEPLWTDSWGSGSWYQNWKQKGKTKSVESLVFVTCFNSELSTKSESFPTLHEAKDPDV